MYLFRYIGYNQFYPYSLQLFKGEKNKYLLNVLDMVIESKTMSHKFYNFINIQNRIST